ncbi:hypothetical protein [Kitasatospora sp. McL0602]|uniref:hypothetical protein n=1 Tax=Kitasatospora sp. McL0602 TaxID=3439530 RepID=UPI003F8C68E5
MSILELRILPPLAVGRLGAADQPMDNYELEVDPAQPLARRKLRPAPTFTVDGTTGEITSDAPPQHLRFTADGWVRPVAPFLEVWALTAPGRLEPLTVALLAEHGLTPGDVTWWAHVANHKLYRRTWDEDDRIDARVAPFQDHEVHPLEGSCPNFWPGRTLPLGHVRYIRPTDRFPGIRLRFTPARGYVYGSSKEQPEADAARQPADRNVHAVLYDGNRGSWLGHVDQGGDPRLTIPNSIYAGDPAGADWVSRGYLDDECDGLVHVRLAVGGSVLTAYSRIGAGPPAYAPDSLPVRTVADELDQAMHGPEVSPADADAGGQGLAVAEEIVRRAVESVRLMNTAVMNGNTVDGRIDIGSTMVRQDTADTGRLFAPIMAPSLVDTTALLNLHQAVLTGLRSGTAPWFADVLRNHNEIGDLSAKGRRKMPALMRGADGRALALTRRQVDLVRKVARREIFEADGPSAQRPAAHGTPPEQEEQG